MVYFIRGLPGSGKSTLAKRFIRNRLRPEIPKWLWCPELHGEIQQTHVPPMRGHLLESDTWFLRPNTDLERPERQVYAWDQDEVQWAHRWCELVFHEWLMQAAEQTPDTPDFLVVANCFTQQRYLGPYIRLCDAFHVHHLVIDLYDGGLSNIELAQRNVHGVPLDTIHRMRAGYER